MQKYLRLLNAMLLIAIAGLLVYPVARAKQRPDSVQLCTDRLFTWSLGLSMYSQDYDETYPIFNSAEDFRDKVSLYTRMTDLTCPVTHATYIPNPVLSGKKWAEVATDTEHLELLRDGKPHRGGSISIAYADGYVLAGERVLNEPIGRTNENARQVQDSLIGYLRDHNDILPPAQTNAAFRTQLRPYIGSGRYFFAPSPNAPFEFNTALSGLSFASIPDPSIVVFFRQITPAKGTDSIMAWLDGRLTRGNVELPDNGSACATRARWLANAVSLYAVAHNEQFPDMENEAAFRAAVRPYLKGSAFFTCPHSKQAFVLNRALSKRFLAEIESPAETLLFEEPTVHDGGITRAFADGHAKRDPR